MYELTSQRTLDQERIANFYHDLFVKAQVEDFKEICLPVINREEIVSDMGGGCGYFASAIARELRLPVRVVDMDPVSIDAASCSGLEAIRGDALEWAPIGDESVACFNLILHHLVGKGESATGALQMRALNRWKGSGVPLFVNEYIYDSFIGNVAGALIYRITSSRFLSFVAERVAQLVPSLRANTFRVGVRFRSEMEWRNMFESQGWRVSNYSRGEEEGVSPARRLLLIKSCRRDSFVLTEA